MSKKHEKRTRAEILAKRERPIVESPRSFMIGVVRRTVPTFTQRARAAFDASKYLPHFGLKQSLRIAARAAR